MRSAARRDCYPQRQIKLIEGADMPERDGNDVSMMHAQHANEHGKWSKKRSKRRKNVARSGNGSKKVKTNANDAKNPGQSEVIIIANEEKKLTGIAFCYSIS